MVRSLKSLFKRDTPGELQKESQQETQEKPRFLSSKDINILMMPPFTDEMRQQQQEIRETREMNIEKPSPAEMQDYIRVRDKAIEYARSVNNSRTWELRMILEAHARDLKAQQKKLVEFFKLDIPGEQVNFLEVDRDFYVNKTQYLLEQLEKLQTPREVKEKPTRDLVMKFKTDFLHVKFLASKKPGNSFYNEGVERQLLGITNRLITERSGVKPFLDKDDPGFQQIDVEAQTYKDLIADLDSLKMSLHYELGKDNVEYTQERKAINERAKEFERLAGEIQKRIKLIPETLGRFLGPGATYPDFLVNRFNILITKERRLIESFDRKGILTLADYDKALGELRYAIEDIEDQIANPVKRHIGTKPQMPFIIKPGRLQKYQESLEQQHGILTVARKKEEAAKKGEVYPPNFDYSFTPEQPASRSQSIEQQGQSTKILSVDEIFGSGPNDTEKNTPDATVNLRSSENQDLVKAQEDVTQVNNSSQLLAESLAQQQAFLEQSTEERPGLEAISSEEQSTRNLAGVQQKPVVARSKRQEVSEQKGDNQVEEETDKTVVSAVQSKAEAPPSLPKQEPEIDFANPFEFKGIYLKEWFEEMLQESSRTEEEKIQIREEVNTYFETLEHAASQQDAQTFLFIQEQLFVYLNDLDDKQHVADGIRTSETSKTQEVTDKAEETNRLEGFQDLSDSVPEGDRLLAAKFEQIQIKFNEFIQKLEEAHKKVEALAEKFATKELQNQRLGELNKLLEELELIRERIDIIRQEDISQHAKNSAAEQILNNARVVQDRFDEKVGIVEWQTEHSEFVTAYKKVQAFESAQSDELQGKIGELTKLLREGLKELKTSPLGKVADNTQEKIAQIESEIQGLVKSILTEEIKNLSSQLPQFAEKIPDPNMVQLREIESELKDTLRGYDENVKNSTALLQQIISFVTLRKRLLHEIKKSKELLEDLEVVVGTIDEEDNDKTTLEELEQQRSKQMDDARKRLAQLNGEELAEEEEEIKVLDIEDSSENEIVVEEETMPTNSTEEMEVVVGTAIEGIQGLLEVDLSKITFEREDNSRVEHMRNIFWTSKSFAQDCYDKKSNFENIAENKRYGEYERKIPQRIDQLQEHIADCSKLLEQVFPQNIDFMANGYAQRFENAGELSAVENRFRKLLIADWNALRNEFIRILNLREELRIELLRLEVQLDKYNESQKALEPERLESEYNVEEEVRLVLLNKGIDPEKEPEKARIISEKVRANSQYKFISPEKRIEGGLIRDLERFIQESTNFEIDPIYQLEGNYSQEELSVRGMFLDQALFGRKDLSKGRKKKKEEKQSFLRRLIARFTPEERTFGPNRPRLSRGELNLIQERIDEVVAEQTNVGRYAYFKRVHQALLDQIRVAGFGFSQGEANKYLNLQDSSYVKSSNQYSEEDRIPVPFEQIVMRGNVNLLENFNNLGVNLYSPDYLQENNDGLYRSLEQLAEQQMQLDLKSHVYHTLLPEIRDKYYDELEAAFNAGHLSGPGEVLYLMAQQQLDDNDQDGTYNNNAKAVWYDGADLQQIYSDAVLEHNKSSHRYRQQFDS